jgi:ElaB/YqjD/DUF883 family membrane-anchored ribosome-binding protein
VADHEDPHDIVLGREGRPSGPGSRQSESLVTHRSEQDLIRRRLDDNRERLRVAVEQVREAARGLTPAGRIRTQPYAWVLGGFAVGLVLGWLTADRD